VHVGEVEPRTIRREGESRKADLPLFVWKKNIRGRRLRHRFLHFFRRQRHPLQNQAAVRIDDYDSTGFARRGEQLPIWAQRNRVKHATEAGADPAFSASSYGFILRLDCLSDTLLIWIYENAEYERSMATLPTHDRIQHHRNPAFAMRRYGVRVQGRRK